MERNIVSSNVQVLLDDLKVCSRTCNLQRGKQIYGQAVECGANSNIYVASALINMYARCGSMVDAHYVFDRIKDPDVVSWTALILGYAENGQGFASLDLLKRMKSEGPAPNSITLLAALKACTSLATKGVKCMDRGKGIYNLAIENGCDLDIKVQSTLINLYTNCGSMIDAQHVFDTMKHPNVVSWTALILGYADNGQGFTALDLFTRMKYGGPVPNSVTFLAALKACTSLALNEVSGCGECRHRGKEIHDYAVIIGCYSDIHLKNTLIDMYAKSRSMIDAHQVFDSIKHPNVVSWNVLIWGYADNGKSCAALDLFTKMRSGAGPAPDYVTFAGVLKACAVLGALEFGRTVHSEINCGNCMNLVLMNCLVDFYAKCCSLVEAQNVFDLHAEIRDMVTWNALLAGFSKCGDNESLFGMFGRMKDTGFRPDVFTFSSILACCSHSGLVEKGKDCFEGMSKSYGIIPNIEHYTCMLDIFGRANELDDAMDMLMSMPCSPDDVTWMTILSACCRWKNVEIGKLAFQSFSDRDSSAYVLMAQLYGSRGMLHEQELVIRMSKTFQVGEMLDL